MNTQLNRTISKGQRRSDQAGFSLLELLVAMLIFLIVSGTIFGLMQIARIDRNRSSRRADVMKNARVAIHMIGRDALNAGLGYHKTGAVVPDNWISTTLNTVPDTDNERDLLTSIVGGNDLFPNNLAGPAVSTDSVAFCYRDMDFHPDLAKPQAEQVGRLIRLKTVAAPTNPAVAQVETEAVDGASDARVNHLFLVESDTTQVAVMATDVAGNRFIDAAPGDPLGLNQPLNGGLTGSVLRQCIDQNDENCTTYVATMKRFFIVNYMVQPDGTLVRILYGNNVGAGAAQQVQIQPIAYNVEDFQVTYVLEDGTVTDKPNAGPDGIVGTGDDFTEGFNLIRQVSVRIQVQAHENDEQTGQAQSITLNATFSTRNMEYDAG